MAILKCKMCGANLNPKEGKTICECEYCGSKQTISTSNDERVLKTIARGSTLRNRCEFDKAYNLYNQLVVDGTADAETYWNIVLCKYGITYVDDYDGTKKPTINRLSTVYIKDDDDYKKAIDLADIIAKEQYIKEANAIQNIQKGILEIVNKEEPFDIFISYKETDEFGDRTEDSVLAQDIYDRLTDEGYRVFLSRVTLSSIAGQSYEPYIYSALFTSKAMILVGTDEEYINAVWVKNEWSRFLNMMLKDKNKKIIPCFKFIDAYDLPKEIQSFQGVDFNKLGAIQDLVIGVNKILGKTKPKIKQVIPSSINLEPQFKRLKDALSLQKWTNSDVICDTILTLDPNNSKAYFGKFLVDNKCKDRDDFISKCILIDNNANYIQAVQLANEEEKQEYQQFEINIKSNIKIKAHEEAALGHLAEAIALLKKINDTANDKKFVSLSKAELENQLKDCNGNIDNEIKVLKNYMETYKDVLNDEDTLLYKQALISKQGEKACLEAQEEIELGHIEDAVNILMSVSFTYAPAKELLDKTRGMLNEKSYKEALDKIKIGYLYSAVESLHKISDYPPAKELLNKVEGALKEKSYQDAMDSMKYLSNNSTLSDQAVKIVLDAAKTKLEEIGNYKDSAELLERINNYDYYKIIDRINFKFDLFETNGVEEMLDKVKDYKGYNELCRYYERVKEVNKILNRINSVKADSSNESLESLVNILKSEYGDMRKIDRFISMHCQPTPKKKKGFSLFHKK